MAFSIRKRIVYVQYIRTHAKLSAQLKRTKAMAKNFVELGV